MKTMVFAAIFFVLSTPAHAQFGGLIRRAKQALDLNEKVESLVISGEEEQKIGATVSERIRTRFGVV